MYERSAIVLERYFNNIFGFNEKINLKVNYKNYKELVEEIEKYQAIVDDEEKIINEFDKVANEIRNIQKEQKRLYNSNTKLEEDRDLLFNDLEESPNELEKKFEKKEITIEENNKEITQLRIKFIGFLDEFNVRQKERNKFAKLRRIAEGTHIQLLDSSSREIEKIDLDKVRELKEFINNEQNEEKNELIELLINNGKDEKIKFNEDVLKKASKERTIIAKKEAECYVIAYDRLKKLLLEVNNDDVKIDKYKKILRDITVKLEFLKAEKIYIISFLDNERLTVINGPKIHKHMMEEACKNFELDIEQINNLYDLILREISGKATKKLYKELYNKEYLKNIEEKEKNFEQEANNIKINAGTIINQNYWRIEGIKSIYEVFQKEISTKFEKDLSEFKLEEEKETTTIDDVLGLDNFDVEMHYKKNDKDEYDYDEKIEKEEIKNKDKQENININNFSKYENDEYEEEDKEENIEELEEDEYFEEDLEEDDDFEEVEEYFEEELDDEDDFLEEYEDKEESSQKETKEEVKNEVNFQEDENKNTKGILNKLFGEKRKKEY